MELRQRHVRRDLLLEQEVEASNLVIARACGPTQCVIQTRYGGVTRTAQLSAACCGAANDGRFLANDTRISTSACQVRGVHIASLRDGHIASCHTRSNIAVRHAFYVYRCRSQGSVQPGVLIRSSPYGTVKIAPHSFPRCLRM